MSLSVREAEMSRSQRARRSYHKHLKRKQKRKQQQGRSTLDAPLLNDDQVLTFAQWCELNSISKRTGRRIIASGNGPVVTELSPRRIGVSVGNNRRWQASRERA